MAHVAAAERSGRPPGGPKIIKISDLFRLIARLGDRFGGWEVGGSIELIETYRFIPSNLDLGSIWSFWASILAKMVDLNPLVRLN